MRRTQLLQETRKMRFKEVYASWQNKSLTQQEAAQILGVCERTFRRYINRYEEEGLDGLLDKRLSQGSHRQAPVDEVMRLQELYKTRYDGWNIKHFYQFYRDRHEGTRSYSWVRNTLQKSGLVKKAPARGKHRRRRERAPMRGMMLHQDGSTHQWVEGKYWDLIITLDDATSEHYSMFFVEQEGTASSFRAMQEVIVNHGLPSSLYTDRGSHYWHTPKAGGKVDRTNLTQFGRAMKHLGIEMIPAYSPEARGRCERMFATHQERLPRELVAEGIVTMGQANRYLTEHYMPAFNRAFSVEPTVTGSAFVPFLGAGLEDILCEHHQRVVGRDNCVQFDGMTLQIPAGPCRVHYRKAKVSVHRYADGTLAIFHGPRKVASHAADGKLMKDCEHQTKDSSAALA